METIIVIFFKYNEMISLQNKEVASLLSIRGLSITVQLLTSIILVNITEIRELGTYYVLYTLSYIGNCIVFIGYDFVLQKKLRTLSDGYSIDYRRFILASTKVIPIGFALVSMFAIIYLYSLSSLNYLMVSLLCGASAVNNYILTLFRHVLLVGAKKRAYASSFLVESLMRVSFVMIFFKINGNIITGADILLAFLVSYLLTSIVFLVFIFKSFVNVGFGAIDNFDVTRQEITRVLIPVGIGSVVYLIHLQGYRPLLGFISPNNLELVGIISFLTTLGATACNSILTIVSQYWVPRQFLSGGQKTAEYNKKLILFLVPLLAVSWPFGHVFIYLLGKPIFYGHSIIISFGVAIEGCSFILSSLGANANLKFGDYYHVLMAGLLGLMFSLVFFSTHAMLFEITSISICTSILLGQIIVVLHIYKREKKRRDA